MMGKIFGKQKLATENNNPVDLKEFFLYN